MSSILTNNSAMVALQTLKTINKDLGSTQSAISTGKEVATAKDNAAIWAVSKVMESDASGFKTIGDGLSLGEATVAVAQKAAEQIVDILTEMKDLIIGAQGENVDHAKIATDLTAKQDQITDIVSGAQFNGHNLLNNAGGPLQVLASLDRSGAGTPVPNYITVASVDFETSLDFSNIDVTTDAASRATSLDEIDTLIGTAVDGAAALGSSNKHIADQGTFVGNMVDSLNSGVGALVDADMEAASARLQALQVQQQLATQSLSIANQAPQNILSLFR